MTPFLAAFLFPLLMMVAATDDVLSGRISNRLTLLIALSFFPMAWAAGMPWGTVGLHAGVGLGLLVAGFAAFSLGLLGGGDAKLLGAAGLWFGLTGLAQFLTMTVLAGGLLALAVMAWSLVTFDAELRDSRLLRRIGWLKPSVPYGYAIAAGAIAAFPQSWWGAALAT